MRIEEINLSLEDAACVQRGCCTNSQATRRRAARAARAGFSLVEAAISTIIVATMFAAAMAAAGVAARDRQTQSEMRTGQTLARMLMTEITQQRYADSTSGTIAPWAGVNTTNRLNWSHMNDYTGFSESPPKYRSGTAVEGTSGWKWQATVDYQAITSLSGAGVRSGSGATTPTSVVGGLIGGITSVIGALLGNDTAAPTDTGLKRIVVSVTSPTGKVTTLTGLRSAKGAVDRVSDGTGFRSWASVTVKVGDTEQAAQAGVPLLNTPGLP